MIITLVECGLNDPSIILLIVSIVIALAALLVALFATSLSERHYFEKMVGDHLNSLFE